MNDDVSAIIEETIVERPSTHLAKHLPPVYLVGPMGAGKTTIGKLLARHLGREFVDCDWYISEQTGADIPWIFAKEGEAGFRDRETKALQELTERTDVVMATGGGAVGRAKNRDLLKKGLVIYLDANVDTQLMRTKKDKNRPLLQSENPRAVLEELYQKRSPLYQEVADIIVPTGRAYPKQMINELLDFLQQYADTHSIYFHHKR
ncbi:shikimate kinase [Moraxella nasovis]|uniref:shikimate kinase n=1 Tax=Moraxella nasovis TaxID=2904121 RepID=UPI001F60C5F0|nr:shikimate kinase [Moraxella nasovis]UNU72861.1 shikimate kinase [Moraxella nasovis]